MATAHARAVDAGRMASREYVYLFSEKSPSYTVLLESIRLLDLGQIHPIGSYREIAIAIESEAGDSLT